MKAYRLGKHRMNCRILLDSKKRNALQDSLHSENTTIKDPYHFVLHVVNSNITNLNNGGIPVW